MSGFSNVRLGNVVGKGLAGGTVYSVVGHPGLVAKVMRPSPENYKEVFVQIYVNRMDPTLSPTIQTYFKKDGKLVVVMDRIIRTLKDASEIGGRLTCPDARIVKGLVTRLHAIGVVHHDLHAGNIAVDAEGRPVVIDFGWADIFPAPISREVNSSLGKGKPFTNYGALEKWLEACKDNAKSSGNSSKNSSGTKISTKNNRDSNSSSKSSNLKSVNSVSASRNSGKPKESPMALNASKTGVPLAKRTRSLDELRRLKVVTKALAKPEGVRKVRAGEVPRNHERLRR